MVSQDVNQEIKPENSSFRKMMGENMEMVDLYIGPNKVHFCVHKELLCNKIPYFDKMFRGHFEEAAMNSATFPEDRPESFDLLVEWVYSGSIRPLVATTPEPSSRRYPQGALSYLFTEFYGLAEKICMPELMDKIMDCLHDLERKWTIAWNSEIIAHGYSTSSEHSSMRRYLCMSYAYLLTHGDEERWSAESMSRALLETDGLAADVIRLTRETGGNIQRPSSIAKCYFHCHDKNAPCALRDAETWEARLVAPDYYLTQDDIYSLQNMG